MKIIDKYLYRELAVFFIGIILGFVVLMIGNTLYIMSEQIFNKRIPIGIVSQIILLRTPAMFVLGFFLSWVFKNPCHKMMKAKDRSNLILPALRKRTDGNPRKAWKSIDT